MKIGITERGDAGLDTTWCLALYNRYVDGAVLVTKNITSAFIRKVLECHKADYRLIVHCGCTGWGGTKIEPKVPAYKDQIEALNNLLFQGFPARNIVFRIDPIFPTKTGLKRTEEVLEYFLEAWPAKDSTRPRVRISVLDEYKHVKERFRKMGYEPIYGEEFGPDEDQLHDLTAMLVPYRKSVEGGLFETCAETKLCGMYPGIFTAKGCISETDLEIMGIPYNGMSKNPQNRSGCLCLSCKKEILPLRNNRQCPHQCAYCYWKQDFTPQGGA